MKRRWPIFLLLLLILLIPSGTLLAASAAYQIVAAGETINNDVVRFNEDLTIADGATVNGSVSLFNGSADINGTVRGDVVVFNGNLKLSETAVIAGDCVVLNGTVTGETAAGLNCIDSRQLLPPGLTNFLGSLGDGSRAAEPRPRVVPPPARSFASRLAVITVQSLFLGLLALVVTSLLPRQMAVVEDALRRKPKTSGFIGFLTFFAVPFLVVLLIPVSVVLILACFIGLLGFPIMLAMLAGLVAAGCLGWIAVGDLAGQKLAGWLNLSTLRRPLTAAAGTAVITLGLGLLGSAPYFLFQLSNWLIGLAIVWLGLGAVALTKFGTQRYPALVRGQATVLPGNAEKVTAVLDTLPDEANTLKE